MKETDTMMDETTDLDVGSASEETETMDLKIRAAPRPFTIESLIGGGRGQNNNNNNDNGAKENEKEISREEVNRQREFLYQQHCLATATGALPGIYLLQRLILIYIYMINVDDKQYR